MQSNLFSFLQYWILETLQTETNKTDNQQNKNTINFCWKEIVRILNSQKAVTTTAQNNYEEVIFSRRCCDTNTKAIYHKLNDKHLPFTKRKFVVQKAEIEKMEYRIYQKVMT